MDGWFLRFMPNENKEQQKVNSAPVNPAAGYLTTQQKATEWNKEWSNLSKHEDDWPNTLADACQAAALWELRWGDKVGVKQTAHHALRLPVRLPIEQGLGWRGDHDGAGGGA